MRIYYCGFTENNAVDRLAAVTKRKKKCGETAYYRCQCGGKHRDAWNQSYDPSECEDHPEFLCEDHIEDEDHVECL